MKLKVISTNEVIFVSMLIHIVSFNAELLSFFEMVVDSDVVHKLGA